jgi:hypothetical protein
MNITKNKDQGKIVQLWAARLLWFILPLAMAQANVEKQVTRQIVLNTPSSYSWIKQQLVKTFKKNQLYLAVNRQEPTQAYYYGCNGDGSTKVYVTIARQNMVLNTTVNVTVEGNLSPQEAEVNVLKLNDIFMEVLANKSELPKE